MSHIPVLLHEIITYLDPKPREFIIDGTVGSGGHAAAILERIAPSGIFLGIDIDQHAIDAFKERISAISKSEFLISKPVLVCGNYADLPRILREKKLPKADGLVIDLGFSSDQLENSGRGFSFLKDEPLIMTYSDDARPVREFLRNMDERTLEGIIQEFGEERFSKRIAHAIAAREKQKRIVTTTELANIIIGAVPKLYERGRIHPATRTFQALRIYANDEFENLRRLLGVLPESIAPRGRVCIISFHSLEDRIVKNSFKELERQHILRIITKKPVSASSEEIQQNPRSRSAKLRVAEMI